MSIGAVFIIGSLNYRVNRAGLLAEPAVNALGHVDIVSGGPPREKWLHHQKFNKNSIIPSIIWSWFGLDGYGSSRACALTEFACDTTFLSSWVAAEGVFTSEIGTQRALFVGVEDCPL